MRRRSARRLAKTSMRRSIPARRRIGPTSMRMARTRRCRKACAAWQAWCAGRASSRGVWPRSASSTSRTARRLQALLKTRPAAGQHGRRALALGRLYRERRCPDRRCAASGPEEPARRTRCRNGGRDPKRCGPPKPRSPLLKVACASVAVGEAAARQAWRDGQRALGDARDALARAEQAAGELAGRRDVLAESRSRIADDLAEAAAAVAEAESQLAGAPDLGDLETGSKRLRATVTPRPRRRWPTRAPSMKA